MKTNRWDKLKRKKGKEKINEKKDTTVFIGTF